MNLKYDFSQEYKEFEKSYDNLDEIINFSLKNGIYLNLIVIDMTYLNSKFGQEPGNILKSEILSFIEKYKKTGKILHYTFVSSKIFFFTKEKLDFKSDLDSLSNKIKSKYDFGDKKVIYIIDKDPFRNNYFYIESIMGSNLERNFKDLFVIALKEENNINELRYHFSSYISKIENIQINSNTGLSQSDLAEITSYWNLLSFAQKTSSRVLNEDIENFDKLINTNDIQIKISNSKYLISSFKIYENYKKSGADLTFGVYELEKYFIWLKMQEMLFFSYKIEKVYSFFNRGSSPILDSKENITQFKDKKDLSAWYLNSIRIFEPSFNLKQREQANKIKSLIDNIDFSDLNSLIILRNEVTNFFDNFHIKGILSIPLEKISPPDSAKSFFTEQFYLLFGSNYNKKFSYEDPNTHIKSGWITQSFIRPGFYPVVKKPKELYQANLFIREGLINKDFKNNTIYSKTDKLIENLENQENNISSSALIRTHLAFLEIDGFNSLNNVYFPNDSDSIVYGKILDILYRLIEKKFHNNENLYKSLLVSIMGDEFFFSFTTTGKISNSNRVDILKFLNEFKDLVVYEFKHINFPKSSKVKIELKNGSEVSFRTVLYKKGFSFFGEDVTLEISRIGITGGVLFDLKCNTQDIFSDYIEILDSYMNQVGKVKNGGKIVEIKLDKI